MIGWASWTAAGLNGVDYFAVPGRPGPLLGLPQHKVVAPGLARARSAPRSRPDGDVDRAAVGGDRGVSGGEAPPNSSRSAVLVDLALNVRDLWIPGLVLSLSGHDLLDTNPGFAQPYDGRHAPLPGPGRELGLELTFDRRARRAGPAAHRLACTRRDLANHPLVRRWGRRSTILESAPCTPL